MVSLSPGIRPIDLRRGSYYYYLCIIRSSVAGKGFNTGNVGPLG